MNQRRSPIRFAETSSACGSSTTRLVVLMRPWTLTAPAGLGLTSLSRTVRIGLEPIPSQYRPSVFGRFSSSFLGAVSPPRLIVISTCTSAYRDRQDFFLALSVALPRVSLSHYLHLLQ